MHQVLPCPSGKSWFFRKIAGAGFINSSLFPNKSNKAVWLHEVFCSNERKRRQSGLPRSTMVLQTIGVLNVSEFINIPQRHLFVTDKCFHDPQASNGRFIAEMIGMNHLNCHPIIIFCGFAHRIKYWVLLIYILS